ncbi:MAG: TusE/DsrC/DsvC family sulfur relay protein, partial [Gammaproteobacteria bacterium]|nr:TusE/DsrC/DsvC family sulfur relay protein [Gammaproteobacteria bacterium]
MSITVNGKEIETTPSGFLVNLDEWSEDMALVIAKEESIELTEKHWDVINYLRDEFINNAGNQPNTRNMTKA